MRVPLAFLALALVLGGAFVGRAGVAQRLRASFDALAARDGDLAKEEGARARALLERVDADAGPERLGSALLGVGCVLALLAAASATRAGPAPAAAAALVGLCATTVDAVYPSARIPGIATVQQPSAEWPYGAVRQDPARYTAFVIISDEGGKKEWTGLVGEAKLPPDGVARSIQRKVAAAPRPVSLFYDPRCPQDIRAVFSSAVDAAAKAAKVEVQEESLCNPEDFAVKRKMLHDEALGEYREIAVLSSLARFAFALALGAIVWRADTRTRGQRGIALLGGGQLVLALGQVVALPLLLYVGMLPEERYYKNPFLRYGENAQVYEWLCWASAGLLALGALASTIGQLLAPEAPAAPEAAGPTAEEAAERVKARGRARIHAIEPAPPAPAPAEPAPAAPAPVPPPAGPSPAPSDANATKPAEGAGGG